MLQCSAWQARPSKVSAVNEATAFLYTDAMDTSTQYLQKAIGVIKSRALNAALVDWKATTAKSFEILGDGRAIKDAYPAINYVLSQLRDNHSFLHTRYGVATKHSSQSALAKPVVLERLPSSNTVDYGGRKFGFVCVKACGFSGNMSSGAERFAKSLQLDIADANDNDLAGWIVDARGNTGGNMWPMIVGVGPILGAGILGYFVYKSISIPWYYENGEAGVVNGKPAKRHANFKLKNSIDDFEPKPVVVLIDGVTASSGEALTISFAGRANTCIMGSHTRGLSTNNEAIKLSDGAMLYLTTSIEADRNRKSYDSGIAPDVVIEQNGITLGSPNDPGILAAVQWLNTHSR